MGCSSSKNFSQQPKHLYVKESSGQGWEQEEQVQGHEQELRDPYTELNSSKQIDLNEKINPIEANLKWAIAKRRREEGGFNGWDKIKKLIENGSEKKRVGILPEGRVIARENTKIFSESGEEIGLITSGTFGPSVNAPVAMGYINTKYAEIGTKIQLEVRGKKHGGKVSELPFFKKSYVK